MPEGDTIRRTAATLDTWLHDRTITAARTTMPGVAADRLVGRTVTGVDARGKHLLIRLTGGLVLHSHMGMTGSWHVYGRQERWRQPRHQARLVLEAGERVAVCFLPHAVALLAERDLPLHPTLAALGPDVLVEPVDVAEIRRRAASLARDVPVGDVLLDQRVVSGIGNIYRCEALFLAGVHPDTPIGHLEDDRLDVVVAAASRLMRTSVEGQGRRGGGRWVYRRGGRPCRRCGTPIASARLGRQGRTAWWCPSCQAAPERASSG